MGADAGAQGIFVPAAGGSGGETRREMGTSHLRHRDAFRRVVRFRRPSSALDTAYRRLREPVDEARELPTSPDILDHQLTRAELEDAVATAEKLSRPLREDNRVLADPVSEAEELKKHEEHHRKAVAVLERITALANGSNKGRTHANIRRCVETFGRHNTDSELRPKPPVPGAEHREAVPRAGPDTGSSEVQIAILTAKIRVAAKAYFEGHKGGKDRVGRRNLRLLLHRRQRLLKYMERKERGSGRWTNMIEKLGLSPATWKNQIEV